MPNQRSRDLTRPLASAAFVLFASACSGESINLGENSSSLEAPESTCPAGAVVARNQADIDALTGCEVLDALLVVPFEGASLRSLASLREVRGSFELGATFVNGDGEEANDALLDLFALVDAGWLFSLEGLENLERAGNLAINGFSVDSLEPLSNLSALTANGGIQLASCSGFRDLSGLENIVGLQSLEINCTDLESLSGLPFPDTMGTVFITAPALRDLGELDSNNIQSLLLIGTALEDLDELFTLQVVDVLNLSDNPELVDVSALDTLLSSVGSLFISNNVALTRLPEFTATSRLGELAVIGNPRLQNIPTFPRILADLEGFEEFFELGRRDLLQFRPDGIDIRSNPALEQLVLPAGLRAAGLVTIEGNPALASISFSDIAAIDFLSIADNAALESVDLGDLATVDELEVSGNPALDLAVFDALQTFSSALSVAPVAPAGEP
jgi:hypothetical protein